MKSVLTLDELIAHSGTVQALSQHPGESLSYSSPVPYTLVIGGLTKNKVLALPALNRVVRCWYCLVYTYDRVLLRDVRGYAVAIEAVCNYCAEPRAGGASGAELVRAAQARFALWRADRRRYKDALDRWALPIAYGDTFPERVAEEMTLRVGNVRGMVALHATDLRTAALGHPVPFGWVRNSGADRDAMVDDLLTRCATLIGDDAA